METSVQNSKKQRIINLRKKMNSIHEFEFFLKKKKLLKTFAEVGVAEGRFSFEMMNWGFKKCYLVDIWEHRPDLLGDGSRPQEWHDLNLRGCQEKLNRFGDKVIYLKGESKDMVHKVRNRSLSFVYLDGNHSYGGVLNDLKIWLPKIKKGGIMAGHDYSPNPNYGVQKAVDEFAGDNVHVLPEQAIENQGFWFYADSVR